MCAKKYSPSPYLRTNGSSCDPDSVLTSTSCPFRKNLQSSDTVYPLCGLTFAK